MYEELKSDPHMRMVEHAMAAHGGVHAKKIYDVLLRREKKQREHDEYMIRNEQRLLDLLFEIPQ